MQQNQASKKWEKKLSNKNDEIESGQDSTSVLASTNLPRPPVQVLCTRPVRNRKYKHSHQIYGTYCPLDNGESRVCGSTLNLHHTNSVHDVTMWSSHCFMNWTKNFAFKTVHKLIQCKNSNKQNNYTAKTIYKKKHI